MSPELITAIKERLAVGQTREEIETAVLAMGHTKEVFEAAFTLAQHDMSKKEGATLPQARTLFRNGWKFVQSRPEVVALLFVPLALETLRAFWFERLPESEQFVTAGQVAFFVVVGVAYIVSLAMALRIVTAKSDAEGTLASAATWMTKNALPLLLIYVLSGLLLLGGLLFFIIPGIILAISITFAQYVYVDENKKGMDALLTSGSLVRGRWFKTVGKIVKFVVLTFIPLFVFGVLFGMVTLFTGEGPVIILGGELLAQAVSAVISVISLHAMYHLYVALKQQPTNETVVTRLQKVWYWGLIGVSVLFATAVVILATLFSEKLEWLEEAAAPIEEIEMEEKGVPAIFSEFPETVLQFANEHNGSYAGVCEWLRPLAEAEGEVTCNDSETAWALQTTDSSERRFCADSTTPGKATPAPIGSQTECISVGE